MGLDMYAHLAPAIHVTGDTDVVITEGIATIELAYWRKHHDLHGWMERLYRKKGGISEQFNCNTVRLTLEDLDQLQTDIESDNLPQTSGFFFGNNPPNDDSKQEDIRFILKAREAIRDGNAVIYDSWW